ncbi:MAG: hypothetical protein HY952_00420 [Elusimicrobia bacterium]|nr:hypothetical protein [Elusimicrobiota bacterium]
MKTTENSTKRDLKALAGAWLAFCVALGAVSNRLVFGAVYFLFLTPVALLFRVFNKDPLDIAWKRAGGGSLRVVERDFTPADMEKPW